MRDHLVRAVLPIVVIDHGDNLVHALHVVNSFIELCVDEQHTADAVRMRLDVKLVVFLSQICFLGLVLILEAVHVFNRATGRIQGRVKERKFRPGSFRVLFDRFPDSLVVVEPLPDGVIFDC